MAINEWAKMPSWWIHKDYCLLSKFNARGSNLADSTAALMLYIAIVLRANKFSPKKKKGDISLSVKLSYDEFNEITFLSRALISRGLKKLCKNEIITIDKSNKTNIYQLIYKDGKERWGKLPFKYICENSGLIKPFKDFTLRKKTELHALKLYLLFIERRDFSTNYARVSFDTINSYTGINRNDIESGLSLLINLNLILVYNGNNEDDMYFSSKKNTSNTYYVRGLKAYSSVKGAYKAGINSDDGNYSQY